MAEIFITLSFQSTPISVFTEYKHILYFLAAAKMMCYNEPSTQKRAVELASGLDEFLSHRGIQVIVYTISSHFHSL